MSSATLRDELSNDPLERGYASMTAAEIVADLHTPYRERQKDSLAGGEVWDRTDPAEFAALSDTEQNRWLTLCGIGSFDPYGPAETVAENIFGGGSTTLATLADYRVAEITRADELGLGDVKPYDVEKAVQQVGGL